MRQIKTFQEFINENLWSDLQDRSSGEVTRKEDYITTREELDDIIWSAYKEQGKGDTLTLDFTGKKILVEDLSSLFELFEFSADLKHIFGLETWDVSNVTNMEDMFDGCIELTELNIGNWDVSKVTNMSTMFCYCKNLTELNIGNWNVSKVKDMSYMFYCCNNLTKLDIGNWDVSRVKNINGMFGHCKKLLELDLRNWNVGKVKNIVNMDINCPVHYIKKGNKLIWQ